MKEPSPIDRQATFNTGLAESDAHLDLSRGPIHLPVVREKDIKVKPLHDSRNNFKNTKAPRSTIAVSSNDVLSNEVNEETIPSISLSVRKKLKKKPRIRVPHLDFSTQEPTIEEETSQDLLIVQGVTNKGHNQEVTPRSIRSNTVIVASPKFGKSGSLSLTTREAQEDKKKQSHEGTIVEFPRTSKTNTSNEKTDNDHRSLKYNNVQNSKSDYTVTRKRNKINGRNYLANQNTEDLQTKRNWGRESNASGGDSEPYKITNDILDPSKEITHKTQLTPEIKIINQKPLFTDMADSRKYISEHETFEEVLQDRNSLLKSETTYHKRIRQLEDELKAMVIQCQTLSDENKELRKMLDQMKRENPEHKKQTNSLLAENSHLKSQNEELGKKIMALEKQLSSKNKHDSQVSELESKNYELESKVAELQKENNSLKLKVTSLEDKNQIISTTLQEKRKENNEMMRAMKDVPSLEVKLKDSNTKLQEAHKELEKIKQELFDVTHLLKNSEQTKEKLKDNISEKDREIAKMMTDLQIDQQTIDELRTNVDKSKNEVKKYESKNQSYKDLEKESAALKSKITSLKAEVESMAGENAKLKQEREEMYRQIERLNGVCTTNANAATDSKKYFKKWQSERDHRMKAESEISQKEKEARNIDKRLKETEQTIQELQKKIHLLEDENTNLKAMDMKELNSDNKILKEENKKLRKMLVERNIELTNKKSELENEEGEGQIVYLERKSKLAKVGVQKVSAWSKDENETRDKRIGHSVSFAGSDKRGAKKKSPNNVSRQPLQAVSSKSQSADVSPRIVKKNSPKSSAKDDVNEVEIGRPSINLPHIDTSGSSDTQSEHQEGYFNLYREKLKRMNGRRY